MAVALTSALTDRIGASPVLELAATERTALEALARSVGQTSPGLVDDNAWLARARLAGCRLPAELTGVIRGFRYDAGIDGTLTVTNLPTADTLPPTPIVPDSVERTATLPATIAVLLAQQLGEVIAYREEKFGALVQNVVPVPSLAVSQSNGGSVPLELHTENAFHPDRPDYVGLLCLRPAHEGGVGTHVAPVRRALALLGEKDRAILHEARFVTSAPPSFHLAQQTDPHPILSGAVEDPDICVDFHATSAADDEAAAAMIRLREALMKVRADLILRPGTMVFLDNRLVVHGRGAFVPRYDGSDRWLHRVFVKLDHRRTRVHRIDGGPVLA